MIDEQYLIELQKENEMLKKELARLAIESIDREGALAKIEAEVKLLKDKMGEK